MKKLLSFSLLTLCIFTVSAQIPDWPKFDSIFTAKYKPTKTPDWLFPVVFQHIGQADTMYFIFDKTATEYFTSNKLDVQLGEIAEKYDASKFHVYTTVGYKDSSSIRIAYYSRVYAIPPSYKSIVAEIKAYQESIQDSVFVHWNNHRLENLQNLSPYILDTSWIASQGLSMGWNGFTDLLRSNSATAMPYIVGGGNGGIFPFMFEISLDVLMGAKKAERNIQHKLFPNPFRSEIVVEVGANNSGEIKIVDIAGIEHFSGSFHGPASSEILINSNTWPTGIYVISICVNQKIIYHEKICKY